MSGFEDLRKIELFKKLGDGLLEDIFHAGVIRFIPKDGLLFQEGDGIDSAFFVISGKLNAIRFNLEGREQVIANLTEGHACNLPSVFTGKPAVSTAVALENSEVFLIAADAFQLIIKRYPELSLVVMKVLSTKLQHFNELAYDLSLRSVRARLAKFILENQNSPQDWTQNAIAAQIGTVREVVSRTMRSFIKEGLVCVERHQIIIADENRLREVAET